MKIMLLGDISPTEITAPYFEREDLSALFGDALSLFKGNDLTFANLECAITQSGNAIEKFGPNLKAPRATAKVLKRTGIDLLGLSNNHIFDFGIEGYQDTIDALEQAGLSYTGFGKNYEDSRKNYSFEKDGERICLIAVCEHEYSYALADRMGSRPFNCYDTIADVRQAKAEHDRVIVIYHGGKEYSRYPSPRMVKLCHALIDNGADLVVGQHSHCICCYEEYHQGHILYGQGNFHFSKPMKEHPDWADAVAVAYDSKEHTLRFIPTTQTPTGIELAKGESLQEIRERMAILNEEMKNGSWLEGWRKFCADNAELYNQRLIRAFAPNATEKEQNLFGHYLDCEAHHDVIAELYKTKNHTNEKYILP